MNKRAVREESHLDDMRSAIRGDFDRLAERRGEQELMRVTEGESDAPAEPEAHLPHEPDQNRSWLARLVSP